MSERASEFKSVKSLSFALKVSAAAFINKGGYMDKVNEFIKMLKL